VLLVCSVVLLLCRKFKMPKTKECKHLWKLRTYSDTNETAIFLIIYLDQTIGTLRGNCGI